MTGPSENPFKRLIGEVHRRSLWQVLAVYLVSGWVVYEVVQSLTEGLGLPDWFPAFAFVLLLIGLPVVLATAFVQEGGPGRASIERVADLDEIFTDGGSETATQPTRIRGLFTWRKATLGGVAAFTVLGLGTTGYMASRTLGVGPFATPLAAGDLTEQDRMVLADFTTQTVDSTLAYAVTDAFRVDVSQSPTVKLADEALVSDVLERMERNPDAALDVEAAREVAVREGFPAVIGGEIDRVGSAFTLSARLVTAESGGELVAVRETAEDEDGVIPAIERLSRTLRERIGESLKTVRASPPLRRVRTASLQALERYSQADRANLRGNRDRCVTLLTDALSLDSLFAGAYRLRASCYANMGGHRAQQMADIRQAYQLRARMTDRYRAGAIHSYHANIVGDIEKGIEALESYLELHPDDPRWLNNLSLSYAHLGRYARAEEVIRRRFNAPLPLSGLHWHNLTRYQINQSKFDGAAETLARWKNAFPDSWRVPRMQAQLALARTNYSAAETHVRAWRELESTSAYHRRATSNHLGQLALIWGRFSQAEAHFRDAMQASEEWGSVSAYHAVALYLAYGHLWVRGDSAQARETLDDALSRHPLDSIEILNRPYLPFATAYAMAGSSNQAEAFLQQFRDSVPEEMWGSREHAMREARGWIAVAEGRLDDARQEFEPSDGPHGWVLDSSFALGRIHERRGDAESALEQYERYLTTPYFYRWYRDGPWRGVVLERLGQLYEEQDNPEKAIEYYRRFIDLWKDADPELQPRVEAARQRIVALIEDG